MDYAEIQTKLERVRALMEQHNVGALWLQRVDNIAWLTGGVDVAVNTADVTGVASIVVTQNACSLWTTTIEAPRLKAEDRVEERGFSLNVAPWEIAREIPIANTLGVDMPLEGAVNLDMGLRALRIHLLPAEIERFRTLGAICASAMQSAVNRVQPGQTEHEIAGALADETRRRGATPIVVLIAVDERIHNVRHPLPTGKTLDKYAMLVLCGRMGGLVCSVTRLVRFGTLPADLRHRMDACAEIDAAMIAASQPGATLDGIFRVTQDAYACAGFDGEWKLHHQGGIAGYGAREIIAVPGDQTALAAGMVCAWNPSISGVKSEDSILVTPGPDAPQVLTPVPGWPVRAVTVNGLTIERPLIMEVS